MLGVHVRLQGEFSFLQNFNFKNSEITFCEKLEFPKTNFRTNRNEFETHGMENHTSNDFEIHGMNFCNFSRFMKEKAVFAFTEQQVFSCRLASKTKQHVVKTKNFSKNKSKVERKRCECRNCHPGAFAHVVLELTN